MTKTIQTSTMSPNMDAHTQHQVKEITLTKGHIALVSPQDYEYINSFSWFASVSIYQVRAARMWRKRMVYMHHQVIGIMPWELQGKEIDHINRNSLDNRKSNLRVVTHAENMRNTDRHLNRVGMCFNWRSNSYIVYLDSPGEKRKYLGYRKTKAEALALLESARND